MLLGHEVGEQVRHLRQMMGITLVRDNLAMLAARMTTSNACKVNGDLERDC